MLLVVCKIDQYVVLYAAVVTPAPATGAAGTSMFLTVQMIKASTMSAANKHPTVIAIVMSITAWVLSVKLLSLISCFHLL